MVRDSADSNLAVDGSTAASGVDRIGHMCATLVALVIEKRSASAVTILSAYSTQRLYGIGIGAPLL